MCSNDRAVQAKTIWLFLVGNGVINTSFITSHKPHFLLCGTLVAWKPVPLFSTTCKKSGKLNASILIYSNWHTNEFKVWAAARRNLPCRRVPLPSQPSHALTDFQNTPHNALLSLCFQLFFSFLPSISLFLLSLSSLPPFQLLSPRPLSSSSMELSRMCSSKHILCFYLGLCKTNGV